ncbi:MAG: amino acid adenylation domain-containing protein [Cyanobacteria bacterium P01_E01_bin.6]
MSFKNHATQVEHSNEQQELLSQLLKEEGVELESVSQLPPLIPDLNNRYQSFPLTDMQQAYWIGRDSFYDMGNVAIHSYTEIESADLDLERFKLAWHRLIERHDMLRAVVLPDGQQQIFKEIPPYEISVQDLRGLDPSTVEAELIGLRDRLSHQVMSLEQWPQFEVRASLLGTGRTRLHISIDGWCIDGWSYQILFQDLAEFYQNPTTSRPDFEISFRDYVIAEVARQETEIYQRSIAYWRDRLQTLPPAPELPLAQNPASLTQPHFLRRSDRLQPETWQQLKTRASKAGLTPTGVLLAAYAQVLSLWSRSQKFTINVPRFNRLPLHDQVNHLVGEFASFTLLEVDYSEQASFESRAKRIQEQLWQDLEHQYVSGVRVLRELTQAQRRGAGTTMPIVFTNLPQNVDGQNSSPDVHLRAIGDVVYSIAQTPQVWLDFHYIVETGGALLFSWDSVEELFPTGMLDEMFATYCQLLNALATEESTWSTPQLCLLPPNQQQQRATINATTADIPHTCLSRLLAPQFQQHPHQPAVITPTHTLTYQHLNHQVEHLAHQLHTLGVRPNTLVAVVMDKGWEQVVAVLGILRSGAAYLPIDPQVPPERLHYLLGNAQVQVVLTQTWLNLSFPKSLMIERLFLDTAVYPSESAPPLPWVNQPEDLAYVIYTSGSTGKPKGVMITHRSVVNLVTTTNQRFDIGSSDRVLALTALHHDLSVYDLFGLLAAGGTLVMPAASGVKDPAHWLDVMMQQQITLWNSVPAMMEMLVEHVADRSVEQLEHLRLTILGGDWLPVTLPERLRRLAPATRVLSIGGPTETTVWNISYLVETVEPDWQSIPYGNPMANAQYFIFNEVLEDCPTWVAGEMYCAGAGLAQGYWRDPDKTQSKFIEHPRTRERLYRTGDLGRYLPNGNIEFLGRVDFQLKLRGHRIEPGEIEAVLRQHPDIKEAIVTMAGEDERHQQLMAYVIANQDSSSDLFDVEETSINDITRCWNAFVYAGQQQAQKGQEEVDLKALSTVRQHLEDLSVAYMCRTLTRLGVYLQPGEKHSLDDLIHEYKIQPRYRNLIKQWLSTLTKEGLLQQQGDDLTNPSPLSATSVDDIWERLKPYASMDDATEKLFLYTQRSGDNHVALLKGEIDPLELFFFEGTTETTESLYQNHPAANYFNKIAGEVLRAIVNNWDSEKPLRILEIGAGTGGTTTSLLPVLPPHQVTYLYTDVTTFFINKAREKFKEYSFVEYGILDIDENPQRQGYQLHDFDIIISSNVLHDAHNLYKTLPYMRSLLTPSGLFLIIEATRYDRQSMTTIGFIEGLSHLEDIRAESELPFLSLEQWQRSLEDSGFEKSVFFPAIDSPTQILGEHVIVAQAPATIQKFNSNQLHHFLQGILPEYMLPSTYIPLETFPLTANGKVDRQALSALKQSKLDSGKPFVAPRNPLEETLAEIWKQVLKVERVGIYDGFFELGGDSLLGIQVISKANQQEIDLKPRQILQYPTIAELASLVVRESTSQSAKHDASSDSLVAIKPNGSKKPLFCIHSSSGSADSFIQLSRLIDSEQPLYGLQSRGFDRVYGLQSREFDRELAPILTIEEMAAHYIKAIQTIQPTGPYYLCGWSMGGIVAYEMAQQLQRDKQKVGFLALLDIMADNCEQQLAALSSQTKTNESIAEVLSTSQANAAFSVSQGNIQAMLNYTLQIYPGKITLIKATEQPSGISSNPDFGWHKYAQSGVEVHEVPGDHFSIMTTPYVKDLAKRLNFCLTK